MTDFTTMNRIRDEFLTSMVHGIAKMIRFAGLMVSAAIVLTCAGILALNFYHVEIAEFLLNWGSYFNNQTTPNRWILDH